ncbi:hypothetical protein BD779DRAFT_1503229 [Infundibulicybe gibba]|nr:hypothetical protein BD779DRAFT_1503229 [Infundibulicybe gibba]
MSTPPMIPQAASTLAPIFMPSQTMPFAPNPSTLGQLSGGLQHTAALPSKLSAPRGIPRVGAVVARDAGASTVPSKSTSSQPPLIQKATKMKMNETNPTSTVVIDSLDFSNKPSAGAEVAQHADLSQLMDMDSKGGMQGTIAKKMGGDNAVDTSPSLGNITPPMALRDNIPVSHAAFRALQSRLMAALLAMTPPSTRTALFHVQSANNTAQESVAAAQACLASAEQACDRVNSALVVVEHLGGDAEKNNEWEWKELVSEFKSDLRALSDWVGEKEAQETRVRLGKKKESAAQESGKRPETNHPLSRAFEAETDIARQAWELEREQVAGDPGLPISKEDEAQTLGGYHLPSDINVADKQHPAPWDANDYGQNLRSEHNSPPPRRLHHKLSDPSLINYKRSTRNSAAHRKQGKRYNPPSRTVPNKQPKRLRTSPTQLRLRIRRLPLRKREKPPYVRPRAEAPGDFGAEASRECGGCRSDLGSKGEREIYVYSNNLNTPSLPVSQQPKAGGPATPVALGSAVASSTALDSAPNRPRVRKRKAQKVVHNTAPATLDARSDAAPPPPNKLSCEGGSGFGAGKHELPPRPHNNQGTSLRFPPLHDHPAAACPERRTTTLPTMQGLDIERHQKVIRKQPRIDSPGSLREAGTFLLSDNTPFWYQRIPTDPMSTNSSILSSEAHRRASKEHEYFDLAESSSLSSYPISAIPLANRLAPQSSYGYQRGGDSYRPSYSFDPPHHPFTESEPPSPPSVPATQQLQPPPESHSEARRNRNRRGARGGSPNNESQLEQRIPSKSLMDRIDGDAGVYF